MWTLVFVFVFCMVKSHETSSAQLLELGKTFFGSGSQTSQRSIFQVSCLASTLRDTCVGRPQRFMTRVLASLTTTLGHRNGYALSFSFPTCGLHFTILPDPLTPFFRPEVGIFNVPGIEPVHGSHSQFSSLRRTAHHRKTTHDDLSAPVVPNYEGGSFA